MELGMITSDGFSNGGRGVGVTRGVVPLWSKVRIVIRSQEEQAIAAMRPQKCYKSSLRLMTKSSTRGKSNSDSFYQYPSNYIQKSSLKG